MRCGRQKTRRSHKNENKPTFLEPPERGEVRTLGEEKEGKGDGVPGSLGRSPNSPPPTGEAPGCPRPCEAPSATPSLPQVARNLAQLVPVWCWAESRSMGLRQGDVPKQGTTGLFTVLRAQLWICGTTPDSPVETAHPASMVLALQGHASGLDGPCFLLGPPPCAYPGTVLMLSPLELCSGGAGWSPGMVLENPQVP